LSYLINRLSLVAPRAKLLDYLPPQPEQLAS
jgi:hypothetical protein